jgi:hypothetical protein
MNGSLKTVNMIGVVLFVWLIGAHAEKDASSFGGSLNGVKESAQVRPAPAFYNRPLMIECRVKVNGKKGYNIFLACEPKSSPAHWELYTHAGSGYLALFVPGNTTQDIRSTRDIADGQWHSLAAWLDGKKISLYCDGMEVAQGLDSRPGNLKGSEGNLSIGALVGGGLGCDGLVDEVRISRVLRPVNPIPVVPFQPDEATLGLWHLDEPGAAREFADTSKGAHAATRIVKGKLGGGVASATGTRASELIRPKDGQVGVIAPESQPGALRQLFTQAQSELKLISTRSVEEYRDGLLVDWDELGWHWSNQASGREKLPNRADEQVYDRHALATASDGDALGVIVRRTQALLDHLRHMAPAVTLRT